MHFRESTVSQTGLDVSHVTFAFGSSGRKISLCSKLTSDAV